MMRLKSSVYAGSWLNTGFDAANGAKEASAGDLILGHYFVPTTWYLLFWAEGPGFQISGGAE
jgi:hypothetical protein